MPKYNLDNLLKCRCIGPFRGGRVVTVAGDSSDLATFYFGACAGGVWKTTDAGIYWECVSDGYFKTSSVGALAVSDADSNVIYAGMGETTIRTDVSHGDGVYKSTDAGRSWQHMGLEDTRHIGKIVIHPKNPDIVYVAALGHAFGTNEERGVFRSMDGGKTWKKVLYKSEKAGAVDISIDVNNPRILYATIWEAYRSFWQISSGGPDSGLYRSMDGGDTWGEISLNKGLPKGVLGKLGVAVSPVKPDRVWALLEAENSPGLYRSEDYGDSWKQVSDNGDLYGRAWYYIHLTACTQDADTVYVNCFSLWKSIDGGQNFTQLNTPHGDNHALWIDPNNAKRMIQGNDGGACVSLNGGDSWSNTFSQPTSQIYHIATDNQYPFHVYGTQQDNTSFAIPSSQHDRGAIPWSAGYQAGTGESGYIAVHPEEPNIVYVGAKGSSPGGGNSLQRYDRRTKQIRLIANWPELTFGHGAESEKYRFNWTYPIVLSPHDPNILYVGGNHVFRSKDEGQTWETISPDLSRADPETLKISGGPINRDSLGAETYATVFTFIESPHEAGVLWAGSDDSLIHLSQDDGKTWDDVTPPDIPVPAMISIIEPSPTDAATVYVAATRYKLDDPQPYLYKTNDYGKTWQRINSGIPDNDFTRMIRADPQCPGLLYAGTETGLYISFDDGANWDAFQLNLPVSPVYDILIKENNLIVATHGRSIWILDDLTPLHQLTKDVVAAKAHLFKPKDTVRPTFSLFGDAFSGAPGRNYNVASTEILTHFIEKSPEGASEHRFVDAGENPPNGLIVTYALKEKPAEPLKLAFLDKDGKEIVSFESKPEGEESKSKEKNSEVKKDESQEEEKLYAPANPGMNRFIWNMRYANGVDLDGGLIKQGPLLESKNFGPYTIPGTYQVQLTLGDHSQTQSFNVFQDPRTTTSADHFNAQLELLLAIRDKRTEVNEAITRIRDLKTQIEGWLKRVEAEEVQASGKALQQKLYEIEETFIYPGLYSYTKYFNHGSRLAAKLAELIPVVASADFEPTQGAKEVFAHLTALIDEQLSKLNQVLDEDVVAFNEAIQAGGSGALVGKV